MAKLCNPIYLFEYYPTAEGHTNTSPSYTTNGFLSTDGGAVAVNKCIVEKQPSYDELVEYINENTKVKHPDKKVGDHIRNLRYNIQEVYASQWGIMEVLKADSYDELPPAIVITINGKDILLPYDTTGKGARLLRKAEKIRSPLLEQLSELAKNRYFS